MLFSALLFSAATLAGADPTLVTLLESAGGPNVRVRVVSVETAGDANCNVFAVVRPKAIRISGRTPFILQGVDAKGLTCQTLVRATIDAQTQVQSLVRDVEAGAKLSPEDFASIWVPLEFSHGKLRHPVRGVARKALKKNSPVGRSAVSGSGEGPVRVVMQWHGVVMEMQGVERRCRGIQLQPNAACVRLRNGDVFTGVRNLDGAVEVELQ